MSGVSGNLSTPGFFEAQQSARRSKVFFWLQTYCMMCLWSKMFGCGRHIVWCLSSSILTLPYSTTLVWCADVDLICSVLDHFFPRGMCQKILGDQNQPGVQGIPCYHWISLGSGKLEQRGFTGFQDVKRFHRWLCPQVEQSYHQQQKMLEVWAPATWTITWHTSLG
jgi:hypothetical protein